MAAIVSKSWAAARGASPADGSSRRSTAGSTMRAMAMASTWRWPPESVRAACRRFSARTGKRAKIPLDPRPALARLEESAHLEVLAHRHARKDVLLLRHEGEAEGGDGARRSPPDGLPAQPHRAVVWGEQARDHLEERRFARAVGTDDADDLARLEGEIHALEDFVGGAVARDHALHHEERRRGQEAHWRSPM